jgi:hypothetical protein
MKIHIYFLCLAFLFSSSSNSVLGQQRPNIKDSVKIASWNIKDIGYFWRLDSLANNGYRRCAVHRILDAKLDKMSRPFLFEHLGKPNRESKRFDGSTEYIYYYFDILAMPKSYDAPLGTGYISFLYRKDQDWASSITEGDIDR